MTKLLALSLLMILFLASCGRGAVTPTLPPATETIAIPTSTPVPPTPTPTDTPIPTLTSTSTPTATPIPIIYGPNNFPAGIDPLTGIHVANPALLDRRPIEVKVNFASRAIDRPTWGLSFADIVYEYYHNGGVSRFTAIFYGQDASEVGPVRSGRLLDDSLIRMYKSYFAYGGATPEIEVKFLNAPYANRLLREGQSAPCPPTNQVPFCRFEPTGIDALLTGTNQVSAYETQKNNGNTRQNLDGMYFAADTPAGGKAAGQIFTRYSYAIYSRWDYDPTSGTYLRFQDSQDDVNGAGEAYEPFIDRTTNQQITADNVVVLVVPDQYVQRPPNEIVDILLNGTGQAYAFRDGQVYDVRWNRPTTDSVLYLTFPDGTNYPFKPGTTWIQIVNKESTIKTPEDGSWHFTYYIRP
jgi:hypothetical protein